MAINQKKKHSPAYKNFNYYDIKDCQITQKLIYLNQRKTKLKQQ